MKNALTAALALVLVLLSGRAQCQEALPEAEKLYASAQYAEALKLLDELKAAPPASPSMALRVDQNRALCLLALDRKADAQRAIEAVIDADPFYQPGEDDAAPKVRAAFREVRVRILPQFVQRLYGRGKQAYDHKTYDEAASTFELVLALLDDPDLSLDKAVQADMRLVTRGFLDLCQAMVATAPPAAAPPANASTGGSPAAAGSPAAGDGTGAPAGPPRGIYDASAPNVVPPMALRQPISIPDPLQPFAEKVFMVELIITPSGQVEAAAVQQPAGGSLEILVLRAARSWRYRPALKDGKPVKYRCLVKIVVPARAGQ